MAAVGRIMTPRKWLMGAVAAGGVSAYLWHEDRYKPNSYKPAEPKPKYTIGSEPGVTTHLFSAGKAQFKLTAIPGSQTALIENVCGPGTGHWVVDVNGQMPTGAQVQDAGRSVYINLGKTDTEWTLPEHPVVCTEYLAATANLSPTDQLRVDRIVKKMSDNGRWVRSAAAGLIERYQQEGRDDVIQVALVRVLHHPTLSRYRKELMIELLMKQCTGEAWQSQRKIAYRALADWVSDAALEPSERRETLRQLFRLTGEARELDMYRLPVLAAFVRDASVPSYMRLEVVGSYLPTRTDETALAALREIAQTRDVDRPIEGNTGYIDSSYQVAWHVVTAAAALIKRGQFHVARTALKEVARNSLVFPRTRLVAIHALSGIGGGAAIDEAKGLALKLVSDPAVATPDLTGSEFTESLVKQFTTETEGFALAAAELYFDLGGRDRAVVERLARESHRKDIAENLMPIDQTLSNAMFERLVRDNNATLPNSLEFDPFRPYTVNRTELLRSWLYKTDGGRRAARVFDELRAEWMPLDDYYLSKQLGELIALLGKYKLESSIALYGANVLQGEANETTKMEVMQLVYNLAGDQPGFVSAAQQVLQSSDRMDALIPAALYLCAKGDLVSFNQVYPKVHGDGYRGSVRLPEAQKWTSLGKRLVGYAARSWLEKTSSPLHTCIDRLEKSGISRFTDTAKVARDCLAENGKD